VTNYDNIHMSTNHIYPTEGQIKNTTYTSRSASYE